MIDIPLNKALVAVERGRHGCDRCVLENENCPAFIICNGTYREDGKNVIFKLVDLPGGIKDNSRVAAVREKAERPGVWGIEVDGRGPADVKETLDRNAGERQ